jgi:phosphate/sulfate permease
MFSFLQIISACYVAFAHGANDVANAIGPIAAALGIIKSKSLHSPGMGVPTWLLAFGGVGIVVGLATLGWRVIQTIGKKITELTPTRGFSAEFGAAITILVASKLGLPISTTHCIVGAVLGVGLAKGISALNLRTLRDIALSWVITIPSFNSGCSLSIHISFSSSIFFLAAISASLRTFFTTLRTTFLFVTLTSLSTDSLISSLGVSERFDRA